jgi:hypothetical protein
MSMFHMTNDSGLFHDEIDAEAAGARLDGNELIWPDGSRALPLYEGKMIWPPRGDLRRPDSEAGQPQCHPGHNRRAEGRPDVHVSAALLGRRVARRRAARRPLEPRLARRLARRLSIYRRAHPDYQRHAAHRRRPHDAAPTPRCLCQPVADPVGGHVVAAGRLCRAWQGGPNVAVRGQATSPRPPSGPRAGVG